MVVKIASSVLRFFSSSSIYRFRKSGRLGKGFVRTEITWESAAGCLCCDTMVLTFLSPGRERKRENTTTVVWTRLEVSRGYSGFGSTLGSLPLLRNDPAAGYTKCCTHACPPGGTPQGTLLWFSLSGRRPSGKGQSPPGINSPPRVAGGDRHAA